MPMGHDANGASFIPGQLRHTYRSQTCSGLKSMHRQHAREPLPTQSVSVLALQVHPTAALA